MATESVQRVDEGAVGHAVIARTAVAAAATGAAAYGLQRLRASHEDSGAADESGGVREDQGGQEKDEQQAIGKRGGLTQALSTKVADAKNAASRYTSSSRRSSSLNSAWEAAAEHLLPFAREAAASLGRTVAKKAPDLVREELMPRFIDGFEEAAD